MFNPRDFALNLLKNNPQMMNSAMGQQAMQAIQNGDNQAGQQMANNILKSYGITKEQALQQARQFFNLR